MIKGKGRSFCVAFLLQTHTRSLTPKPSANPVEPLPSGLQIQEAQKLRAGCKWLHNSKTDLGLCRHRHRGVWFETGSHCRALSVLELTGLLTSASQVLATGTLGHCCETCAQWSSQVNHGSSVSTRQTAAKLRLGRLPIDRVSQASEEGKIPKSLLSSGEDSREVQKGLGLPATQRQTQEC